MRKKFLLFTILFACLFTFLLNNSVSAKNTVEAFNTGDYLSNDYSDIANNKLVGKYYKCGVMGHRQVLNLGDGKIIAKKIEDLSDTYQIGTVSSYIVCKSKSVSVNYQVSTSSQVKIGLEDMFKASIDLEGLAEVGGNTSLNREFTLGINTLYSKTITNEKSEEIEYNLSNLSSDKVTFKVSQVSLYIEFDVKSSYTEEQQLKYFRYQWVKLNNTVKENYKIRFYIDSFVTFYYNDNTFGNTVTGIYNCEDSLKTFK